MTVYRAPEGYKPDVTDGRYYKEYTLYTAAGTPVRHVVRFDAMTGQYTQQSFAATPPPPPISWGMLPKAPAVSKKRRRTGLVAAVVATLLLGAVGAGYLYLTRGGTPAPIDPVLNDKQQAASQNGLLAIQDDWVFYSEPASGGALHLMNLTTNDPPMMLTDFPVANISITGDKLVFTDMAGSYFVRTEQNGETAAWMLPQDIQCLTAYSPMQNKDSQTVLGGNLYIATGVEDFLQSGDAAALEIAEQPEAEPNTYSYFVYSDESGIHQLQQTFDTAAPEVAPVSLRGGTASSQPQTTRLGTVRITNSPVIQRTATDPLILAADAFLKGAGSVDVSKTPVAVKQPTGWEKDFVNDFVPAKGPARTLIYIGDYMVEEKVDPRQPLELTHLKKKETISLDGHTLKRGPDGTAYFIDNKSGMLMRMKRRDDPTDHYIPFEPVSNVPITHFGMLPNGDIVTAYRDGAHQERVGVLSQQNYTPQYAENGYPLPGGKKSATGYTFYPSPPQSVLPEGSERALSDGRGFHGRLYDPTRFTIMTDENGLDSWVPMRKNVYGQWEIMDNGFGRLPSYSDKEQLGARARLEYLCDAIFGKEFFDLVVKQGVSDGEYLRKYMEIWGVKDREPFPGKIKNPPPPEVTPAPEETPPEDTPPESPSSAAESAAEPTGEPTPEDQSRLQGLSGAWMSSARRNGLPIFSLRIDLKDGSNFGRRNGRDMYGDTTFYECELQLSGDLLSVTLVQKTDSDSPDFVPAGTVLTFTLAGDVLTYTGETHGDLRTGTQFIY